LAALAGMLAALTCRLIINRASDHGPDGRKENELFQAKRQLL
jgi:hypothetical protein